MRGLIPGKWNPTVETPGFVPIHPLNASASSLLQTE